MSFLGAVSGMDETPKRPNGRNNIDDDGIQADQTEPGDQEPPKREKSRTAANNGHAFTDREIEELFASDRGKQLMTDIRKRISRKLWDKSRVEDVFHEVLAGTIQNLKKGHIHESWLTPYVMQITSNQLTKEYDRATEIRENEAPLDVYLDEAADPNANKKNGSPKQHLSEADVALTLNKAYQSLTEKEQRVLVLREKRGCSYEKIASELKINTGYARVIRRRAAFKIAQYLKGTIYEKIFEQEQPGGTAVR
jgi:RNA polymerase sigma factor (sigma-70 family)